MQNIAQSTICNQPCQKHWGRLYFLSVPGSAHVHCTCMAFLLLISSMSCSRTQCQDRTWTHTVTTSEWQSSALVCLASNIHMYILSQYSWYYTCKVVHLEVYVNDFWQIVYILLVKLEDSAFFVCVQLYI